MEEHKCDYPFFGILPLKRLSRVRTEHLPWSRETFKARRRMLVKYNFRMKVTWAQEMVKFLLILFIKSLD
jgi:hypothetical protein